MYPFSDSAAGLALLISVIAVLYTAPQLLIALLAARLSATYRVVIEPRWAVSGRPASGEHQE